MMARAMTTVGTRRAGRPALFLPAHVGPYDPRRPVGAGGPAPAPGPGLEYQSPGSLPNVPYEAAKRMGLGSLGATTLINEGVTGVKTGVATAGIATSIGTSVAGAIGAGAAAGSVVPIIGTAIGAVVGLLASGVLNHKTDPEVANFNQAMALYKQNPQSVLNIADKYLVLAGLFDLQPSQIKGNIPIYKKYGRMGEQRFVTDMCNLIYQAAQTGRITSSDTIQTVMSRIVQPWIDGFGYGQMNDSNTDMINLIILGMIADYVTGNQRAWFAVGGDNPFTNLPKFALPPPPAPPVPPPPVAALPPPVPVQPPPVAQTSQPVVAGPTIPAGYQVLSPNAYNGGPLYVLSTDAAKPGTTIPTFAVINNALAQVGTFQTAGQAAAVAPAVKVSAPPSATNVPAGFTVVGQDAAGNPVFSNSQGVLYSWNGTGMQQFTGALAGNSSQAAQMQAAIQNALAQGYSSAQAAQAAIAQQQAAGQAVPAPIQAQVADQAATTAAAPTVQTAGIGGGLTGTTGLIFGGLALIGLMFSMARPANQPKGRRGA